MYTLQRLISSSSSIIKACLPRRRKRFTVLLLSIIAAFILLTFLIVDDLDEDVSKRALLESLKREDVVSAQWEQKPQAHIPIDDDHTHKDKKIAAIFNYNRAQVEEQLKRVTQRVDDIKQKLSNEAGPAVPMIEREEKYKEDNIDDKEEKEDYEEDRDYVYEEEEDEDDEDDDSQNPAFKPGDFDDPPILKIPQSVNDKDQDKEKPAQEQEENDYVYQDPEDAIYREENRKAWEEEQEYGVDPEEDKEEKEEEEEDSMNEDQHAARGANGVKDPSYKDREPSIGNRRIIMQNSAVNQRYDNGNQQNEKYGNENQQNEKYGIENQQNEKYSNDNVANAPNAANENVGNENESPEKSCQNCSLTNGPGAEGNELNPGERQQQQYSNHVEAQHGGRDMEEAARNRDPDAKADNPSPGGYNVRANPEANRNIPHGNHSGRNEGFEYPYNHQQPKHHNIHIERERDMNQERNQDHLRNDRMNQEMNQDHLQDDRMNQEMNQDHLQNDRMNQEMNQDHLRNDRMNQERNQDHLQVQRRQDTYRFAVNRLQKVNRNNEEALKQPIMDKNMDNIDNKLKYKHTLQSARKYYEDISHDEYTKLMDKNNNHEYNNEDIDNNDTEYDGNEGAPGDSEEYSQDADPDPQVLPDPFKQHIQIETQIPIQEGVGFGGRVDGDGGAPATQIQQPGEPGDGGVGTVNLRSRQGMPLVVDNVYWSQEVEQLVPPGNSDAAFSEFLYSATNEAVAKMEKATWNHCGRPKNQYIHLANGSAMCARYRHPTVRLMYGEVLSFYLSRLLGLDNVPFVALSRVNSHQGQWKGVEEQINKAEWENGRTVALIQWVENLNVPVLSHVRMPPLLLEAYENNTTLTWKNPKLQNATADELSMLIQWSDMIIFDYLTGNYDRFASMQDGAFSENQPEIIREEIRNLRASSQDRKLWLFDNESGFLDAYLLLDSRNGKFESFHAQILKSTCLYRSRTIRKVFELHALKNPEQTLFRYTTEQDPVFNTEKMLRTDQVQFVHNVFKKRLNDITGWIKKCAN